MFAPIGVAREGFLANGTRVRLQARVDVEVLLKMRGLGERLGAVGAAVEFGVRMRL